MEIGLKEVALISHHTLISNCNFTDNNGSVLTSSKSDLDFYDNIWFVNNRADYGAAVKICEASLIFINGNTYIRYVNNLATFKGGAVYANQPCMALVCFSQNSMKMHQLQKH